MNKPSGICGAGIAQPGDVLKVRLAGLESRVAELESRLDQAMESLDLVRRILEIVVAEQKDDGK